MTTESAQDAIEAVISDHIARPPTANVLTAWVVVAEWMDETGRLWLSRGTSEDLSAWRRDGMLAHAAGEDWYEQEGEDE